MWQDILVFWNNLPPLVPSITAVGVLVTALFTGLLYRGRHGLPENIVAQDDRSSSKTSNSDLVHRSVNFYLPTKPSLSNWLIDEIRMAGPRHKWIARAGEGQWNESGGFTGYYLGGDWTDRIRYDPPIRSGVFLIHPDAPKHLRFSFRVRLRYRLRVKRKVDVIPY